MANDVIHRGDYELYGNGVLNGAVECSGGITSDITGDVTGDLTGDLTPAAVAAEHADGAVGTGGSLTTYRYKQNGVIITEIKLKIKGLGAKGGDAGDAIGVVSTAPDAYIGRYVESTYGVVFKVELACLELPTADSGTITADIDIMTNATGTYGYDEAVGGSKLIDNDAVASGSNLDKGEIGENTAPAMTDDDYIYLVEGDTTADTGVYDAGQYILRLYGHAAL